MPQVANLDDRLGDVNVLPQPDGSNKVVVCFMPDEHTLFTHKSRESGNIRAFLALDGSRSMREHYGYGHGAFLEGRNDVQDVARGVGMVLAPLCDSERTFACYWATNAKTDSIEPIGELSYDDWEKARIFGPQRWGKSTKILPVVRHAYERLMPGSEHTVGFILTDGVLDDLDECMAYCMKIGKAELPRMQELGREPFKLILLGVGEEVEEEQLQALNNMFEGTGIEYDMWGCKLVRHLHNRLDIIRSLAELLSPEDSLAGVTSGHVVDAHGGKLSVWSDRVPAKFDFVLPRGQSRFGIVLRVDDPRSGGNTVVELDVDISSALFSG